MSFQLFDHDINIVTFQYFLQNFNQLKIFYIYLSFNFITKA